jgi:hypothetical protein
MSIRTYSGCARAYAAKARLPSSHSTISVATAGKHSLDDAAHLGVVIDQ